jgi:phytol kinase
MSSNLTNTLVLNLLFLGLFGFAEFLYHVMKVQVEYTRKLVHFGTGLLTLLFPLWITNHWYILGLCSAFAVLLVVSKRFKFLPSINAIDRVSHGSILYPVAVYLCFVFHQWFDTIDCYEPVYTGFYIPILILASCDPVAALLGKRFPKGQYKVGEGHKTLTGSGAFFILAFCISSAVFLFNYSNYNAKTLAIALFLALATTGIEAVSPKGWDNLTIPLTAILVLYALQSFNF